MSAHAARRSLSPLPGLRRFNPRRRTRAALRTTTVTVPTLSTVIVIPLTVKQKSPEAALDLKHMDVGDAVGELHG